MSDYYRGRAPMPGLSDQQNAPAPNVEYSEDIHYSGNSPSQAASTSNNMLQYPTLPPRSYNGQNIGPNQNHELIPNEASVPYTNYSQVSGDQSVPQSVGNSRNLGHEGLQDSSWGVSQRTSFEMAQPHTSSEVPTPNLRIPTHLKHLFDHLERQRNYHAHQYEEYLHRRQQAQLELRRLQEQWQHHSQIHQDLCNQEKQCSDQLKQIQEHGQQQINDADQHLQTALENRITELEQQRLEQMRLQDILLGKQNHLYQEIQEMDLHGQANAYECLQQQFQELQIGIEQQFHLQLEKVRREFRLQYEEQNFQLQHNMQLEQNEQLRQSREFEYIIYNQIAHIHQQQEYEWEFQLQLHRMHQEILERVQELELAGQDEMAEEDPIHAHPGIPPAHVPEQIDFGGHGPEEEMDAPPGDDRDANALHHLEQGLQQWFIWLQQNPQPLGGHLGNIQAMLENNPEHQLSLILLILQYAMNFRSYMKQLRRDVMTQHQINALQTDRLERMLKEMQQQQAILLRRVVNDHKMITQLQEWQRRHN